MNCLDKETTQSIELNIRHEKYSTIMATLYKVGRRLPFAQGIAQWNRRHSVILEELREHEPMEVHHEDHTNEIELSIIPASQ
jgi:hypothetical protein